MLNLKVADVQCTNGVELVEHDVLFDFNTNVNIYAHGPGLRNAMKMFLKLVQATTKKKGWESLFL